MQTEALAINYQNQGSNKMDWNLVRTFLTIAEQGSLAGAARELKVNHSTIFRRLNQFEQDLEVRLFDRIDGQYKLTIAGQELLTKAEPIGQSFELLQRQVTGGDYQPRGKIRLTAPDNLAYQYLPNYLARFKSLYPEISVELVVSNQEHNISRLEADIALRATPQPPEHLVGRSLVKLDWAVYAAPNFTEPPQSIEALSQFPIIGAADHMSQLPAFRWLDKQFANQVVIRSNDLCAMAALAEQGMGLALLPADQAVRNLTRLFTLNPGRQSHLWLLTHPDLRKVERIKLLMAHLAKCIEEDERFARPDSKTNSDN